MEKAYLEVWAVAMLSMQFPNLIQSGNMLRIKQCWSCIWKWDDVGLFTFADEKKDVPVSAMANSGTKLAKLFGREGREICICLMSRK